MNIVEVTKVKIGECVDVSHKVHPVIREPFPVH